MAEWEWMSRRGPFAAGHANLAMTEGHPMKQANLAGAATLLALACWSSASIAAPSLPSTSPSYAGGSEPLAGRNVTNPDWLVKPNSDDLADDYPKLPYELGLGGIVFVQCAVAVAGDLTNCTVESDVPTGLGFGDAALKMTQKFRMKPEMVDGQPVSGATVLVPITLAPAPDRADVVPGSVQQPSDTSIALARRLLTDEEFQAHAAQTLRMVVNRFGSRVAIGTPEDEAAIAALDHAADPVAAELAETEARRLANTVSVAELKVRIARREADPGPPSDIGLMVGDKMDKDLFSVAWEHLFQRARIELCGKITCLKADTASGVTH